MILKLAALGALGYAGYKFYEKNQSHPAFSRNRDTMPIRDAGPAAMRDTPQRGWSKTDEASDESFPASDPPGNY